MPEGNIPNPLGSGWTEAQLALINKACKAIKGVREKPEDITVAKEFVKTAVDYEVGEITLRGIRETRISGEEFKRLTAQSISLVINDAIANRNLRVVEIKTMLEEVEISK